MIATFMNTAFVLSIGIFFSLMVAGLSSKLPSSLSSGLIAQGIPAAAAHTICHLPPIGVLFAAFLGYNPMKQLLGPLLAHLPSAHAAYVTGRQFFPQLITAPFKDGLGVAFAFAIAASVIAGDRLGADRPGQAAGRCPRRRSAASWPRWPRMAASSRASWSSRTRPRTEPGDQARANGQSDRDHRAGRKEAGLTAGALALG